MPPPADLAEQHQGCGAHQQPGGRRRNLGRIRTDPPNDIQAAWACAFRRSGQLERVREQAIAGIDAERAVGFPWSIGWGERLLGRVALTSGDLAAAGERLSEAMSTFGRIPARFEIAVTHLDLAELSRACGDPAAAGEHLRTAWTAFDTLRVGEYTRRAEMLAARFGLLLARAS